MKTQRPEAPKQARTGRAITAFKATVSVGLPLCAVLTAGCPGIQVRPEPFECPEGAAQAMRDELGWTTNDEFSLFMDDRYPGNAELWFQAGAEVVGVVRSRGPAHPYDLRTRRENELTPIGTRFLGGKVYLIPDKTDSYPDGRIVVKYDRVKVPGKEELPVCFVVVTSAVEMKDTAGKSINTASGWPVTRWP